MTVPIWLARPTGLPPKTLAIWNHYAPGLYRAGSLTQDNAENLRSACRCLALAAAAAEAIEAHGVLVGTETEPKRANPAIAVMLSAQKEAARLLAEFDLA